MVVFSETSLGCCFLGGKQMIKPPQEKLMLDF